MTLSELAKQVGQLQVLLQGQRPSRAVAVQDPEVQVALGGGARVEELDLVRLIDRPMGGLVVVLTGKEERL